MRRTGRPKGLGLLAVALIVGACDAPTSSAAPTPTRAPEATPVQTTFSLFTDVWYEGLVLHVDRATATLDARGGTVDVGLRVDNPGDEPSDLNAKLTLLVAGTRIEPTRESQVPTAPAGGTAPALLSFELQGIASADDAVLEIGTAPEHVAKVPFRGGVDEAVAFQPIDLKLSGAASAGDIRITLQRAVIRWDLPDWSQELEAGLRALTLTYDVTYNGAFPGGFAFTGGNVALRLPNGKVVQPRRDGRSQSIELIGSRKTKKNLFSRFEIPADAAGAFSLLVRNGTVEGAIKFTIGD